MRFLLPVSASFLARSESRAAWRCPRTFRTWYLRRPGTPTRARFVSPRRSAFRRAIMQRWRARRVRPLHHRAVLADPGRSGPTPASC